MPTQVLPMVEVTAPTAAPYPFGLFSVAPPQQAADERFAAGTWWRSNACNLVGVTYNPCTVDDPVPAKDPNVICGIVTAPGFTVYAKSEESMGGAPTAERFAAARASLLAGEQNAVESVLWQLLLDATVAPDSAADVTEAVAVAEGQIAQMYGGQAVIHMSRYTATLAWPVVRIEGGRLVTVLGSGVAAGGGYLPAPTATGSAVDVIATGGLSVVRGQLLDLGEAFNTQTNQIDAIVERSYSVGWDCGAVRVHVT